MGGSWTGVPDEQRGTETQIDEVARIAAVQDASPDLTVGTVSVGPHA